MPLVTVVIPVYNSVAHLKDAIDSVIRQTFTDWELLVINEYGSDDGSVEVTETFSEKDSRIRLIQNQERLGLSESLNLGIRMASGTYIARLDADDLAHPRRLEKQVARMEADDEIVICGSYQHHIGKGTDWIHKPTIEPEQLKANLLFYCDLCHSTLMLRKETIENHSLWYDRNILAEDFELWTRVVQFGKIVNIPEVLGEYRITGENITTGKRQELNRESGMIVADNLKRNLDITLSTEDQILFQGWESPFRGAPDKAQKLDRFEQLFRLIYNQNLIYHYYDNQSLLNAMTTKWCWAKYRTAFNKRFYTKDLDEVFKNRNLIGITFVKGRDFWKEHKGIRNKVGKIIKRLQS